MLLMSTMGQQNAQRYRSSQVASQIYDVSLVAAAHLVCRYYAFDSVFASVLELLLDSLRIVPCAGR